MNVIFFDNVAAVVAAVVEVRDTIRQNLIHAHS